MSQQVENVGRYELKFVVPVSLRSAILDSIAPHAVPDPHAHDLGGGRLGYVVRSFYFDTPSLADYFDRLAEKRVRNRVRVRTYDQPELGPPVFLENKRKSGRWVVKHRVRVSTAGEWLQCQSSKPWAVLGSRAQGKDRYAASVFSQLTEGGGRQPTSAVIYEREVFVARRPSPGNPRLTLDHDIRAAAVQAADDLFAEAEVRLLPPEWMVLELKFERFAPAWMIELRRDLRLSSVPVSKFGLSVATCLRSQRPHELRYLTPRPILRQGFAA